MGKIVQTNKTKRKYRKSKTTKRGNSRYCNTCGHKV